MYAGMIKYYGFCIW
jgi:hypothetical protein